MFLRYLLIVFITVLPFCSQAQGQNSEFCDALFAIMDDAPNSFENIKGKMLNMNQNATAWMSPVKMPGSIGHRVVFSMGLFYEVAFAQSTNKNDIRPHYHKLKQQFADCLAPMGYTLTYQDNFTAGLADYKKVVFMKDLDAGTKKDNLPPHITMEVIYNKDFGQFTLVAFVFQH